MKNIAFYILYSLFSFFIAAETMAAEVGMGFYVQAGSGSAEWDAEDDFSSWSFDTDTSHTGIGFVLDTAVAKNKVFNYRFNVGIENFSHDPDSGSDLDMDSIVFDHDFGFAVVRNRDLRVWLGPQLRISFSAGSPDNNADWDIWLQGIGLGPVAGINFHTGTNVSLSLKAGFIHTSYFGEGTDANDVIDDVEYDVEEDYSFVNFAVLFR